MPLTGLAGKPAFLTWMLGAAIMVVVYSRLTDPTALLIGGAIMGFLRQRHAGRLRRADERALPHCRARHRAERAVQYRPGDWRVWAGGGRGNRGVVRFQTAIALLAVLYLVDVVAMWFLIPERKGQELA